MGAMYFLQFIVNFPCYSIGISFCCQFFILSNCNFAFFFIFCEFSMVSNGKFASCHFPMLFNGKFAFCHFPMLFNGNLRIEKVQGGRTDGRTYIRTDVRKFTPVSCMTSALLGRCPRRDYRHIYL